MKIYTKHIKLAPDETIPNEMKQSYFSTLEQLPYISYLQINAIPKIKSMILQSNWHETTKKFKGQGHLYPRPWMSFDLWKLELLIVGVHLSDLLSCRCTEDFDDLYQLIHATVSWEDWFTDG